MPDQKRLMCIGHSHVRRMQEYLTKEESNKDKEGALNFNISKEQLSTSFFGFGGIRSEHLLVSSRVKNRSVKAKPATRHARAAQNIENALLEC